MARGGGRAGGGRGGGKAVLRMDLDEADPRNPEWHLELRNALERITGDPVFESIHTELPLGIAARDLGGAQAPFSQITSMWPSPITASTRAAGTSSGSMNCTVHTHACQFELEQRTTSQRASSRCLAPSVQPLRSLCWWGHGWRA